MSSKKIISSLIFAVLAISIIPTTNIFENVLGEKPQTKSTALDLSTSEVVDAKLDDVVVSVAPIKTSEDGLTTFDFTITDEETGAVLSHIDWLITIKDPDNNKLFQSSTIHSHVGKNSFSYGFEKEGVHTISVQVASLGPKMLGMDIPAPAQTRAVVSGDPMNGWQDDPNKFFGAKNIDFKLEVPKEGTITFEDNTKDLNMDIQNVDNSPVLEGNENTKVNVELLTNGQKVIAGEPTTILINVKTENGTDITHPDILAKLSKGETILYQSAEQGNPQIAVNGALHGHTGQIAFDYTFPYAGIYSLDAQVNSIPVSNVMFGTVNPKYVIVVEESELKEIEENSIKQSDVSKNSNIVSILGQESPFYEPTDIEVKKGSSVTFINNDAVPHTATSTQDELGSLTPSISDDFDTGLLKINEQSEITLNEEGTFNYFCTIHPFMQGSITVTS
ncbi:MAG: cupredoxin domain-containing protein [Nitrososphaeraceae archaeon]